LKGDGKNIQDVKGIFVEIKKGVIEKINSSISEDNRKIKSIAKAGYKSKGNGVRI
jgi:hypothetical protein